MDIDDEYVKVEDNKPGHFMRTALRLTGQMRQSLLLSIAAANTPYQSRVVINNPETRADIDRRLQKNMHFQKIT